MKTFTCLSALCLFLPYLTSVLVVNAEAEAGPEADENTYGYELDMTTFFERFHCPDPEDFVIENPLYKIECVEASIPPWPMCLFHDVDYFIDSAISSANRCCDPDDLEACRCPLKYDVRWRSKMAEWCPKIDECLTPDLDIKTELVTEAWAGVLMSNFPVPDEDGDSADSVVPPGDTAKVNANLDADSEKVEDGYPDNLN
jgi:hypothetical protein